MKFSLTILFLTLIFILSLPISTLRSQTFDGEWSCLYSTIDDQPNATGLRTISVGVIKENTFVALVSPAPTELTNTFCYLIGYTNADSVNGRMWEIEYNKTDLVTQWSSGFDAVDMRRACDLAATADSFIYVANNDVDRNILVFKMTADNVVPTDYRLVTGADSIWAIDVDASGRVYVTTIKSAPDVGQILVFDGFQKEPDAWGVNHSLAPLATLTVPDTGRTRGIAVNPEGTAIYVSNYDVDKIYCFTGDASSGYNLNSAFDCVVHDTLTATTGVALNPGPWGLGFMKTKNVLFASMATNFQTGIGYQYGRVYAINPNNGLILDTIDCAAWNFANTGSWSSRPGGTMGTVSGYTSPYNVDFDENFNVYNQSFYGWTVDKWQFSGTIPTIPLTITGIVREENIIPEHFALSQNYPNPFNPTTTIEFSLPKDEVISVAIYTINGELITPIINNAHFTKGSYKLTFDASNLASGNYIYTMTAGELKLSKKMTLIK